MCNTKTPMAFFFFRFPLTVGLFFGLFFSLVLVLSLTGDAKGLTLRVEMDYNGKQKRSRKYIPI